jgi:hypothetical protein
MAGRAGCCPGDSTTNGNLMLTDVEYVLNASMPVSGAYRQFSWWVALLQIRSVRVEV